MTEIPRPNLPNPARPRRSSIAQSAATTQPSTPAAPPAAASAEAKQPSRPRAAASAQTISQPPAPSTAPPTHRMGGTKDILLSVPDELKERMVRTIAYTLPRTGVRHQQQFIRWGIEKLCAELEEQYNNGDPFPEIASS